MSENSLTLVQQIKTSKIINDTAKVQQKSEKITAFGGIFFVLDKFDSILLKCDLYQKITTLNRESGDFGRDDRARTDDLCNVTAAL